MKIEFFILTKIIHHRFWQGFFYKENNLVYQKDHDWFYKYSRDLDHLIKIWRSDGYLDVPIFAWED